MLSRNDLIHKLTHYLLERKAIAASLHYTRREETLQEQRE